MAIQNVTSSSLVYYPRPPRATPYFKKFALMILSLGHRIQTALSSFASLFTRYWGDKRKVGYAWGFDERLSPERAKNYFKEVALTGYTFCGREKEFIEPFNLRPILTENLPSFEELGLVRLRHAYFDKHSGLKFGLTEKGDDLYISVVGLPNSTGTIKSELEKDYRSGIIRDSDKVLSLLGTVPRAHLQAEQAISDLIKLPQFRNKKIHLVGMSFGSSVAAYVALQLGLKDTVCFSSLQLGPGLQQRIGDEKLKRAKELITHIFVDTDFINSSRTIHVIDRVMTAIGFRTPSTFGKKFWIPTPFKTSGQSHSGVVQAMITHLGFKKGTRFGEVKAQRPELFE